MQMFYTDRPMEALLYLYIALIHEIRAQWWMCSVVRRDMILAAGNPNQTRERERELLADVIWKIFSQQKHFIGGP